MIAGARRRVGPAALAVALVAGALLVAPATVQAAPGAAGTGGTGVTVVVDFGTLGGGVQVRCATGTVSSGFDALTKAGFTYRGTQRFPGLLCRINGQPADDPCVNAPPADRYWAYWTSSQPGGTWSYSEVGAGNRTPPQGSVEGWAFSDGCDRKPGSGPCPAAPTTTTPPTTPTTGSNVGGGGTTTSPTPGPRGTAPPPGDGDTTTTSAAPGASTKGDAGSSTTTRAGDLAPAVEERGDDEVAIGVVARADDRDGGGGSPVGMTVGIGAVLVLAVAGTITVRRRRGADDAGL